MTESLPATAVVRVSRGSFDPSRFAGVDAVNKKVMAEPVMKDMDPTSMRFDMKRMFWGGFKEIVRL